MYFTSIDTRYPDSASIDGDNIQGPIVAIGDVAGYNIILRQLQGILTTDYYVT